MTKHLRAAACMIAILVATSAMAQRQDHDQQAQFNEHDRQVTQEWYNQHQSHPPKGLRSQDRLSSEQEGRLQSGHALTRDLQKQSHAVPTDLRRRLPAAPAHHRYMVIGGHVVLVDSRNNVVRDVIHVHK